MGFSLELGPEGSPDRTLGEDELTRVDAVKEAAAVSDWEVDLGLFDKNIDQHALKKARLYHDSTLLMHGKVDEFDWSARDGTTTIYGRDVAHVLEDAAGTELNFTSIPTWKAIYDGWALFWWTSFFTDGFEDGDTTGWDTPFGGTLSAQQNIVAVGDWAAKMDNSGGGGGSNARRTFSSAKTDVYVKLQVRWETSDALDVYLAKGGTVHARIRSNADTFEYRDGSSWVSTGIAANVDTWHTLEMVADVDRGEYSVYIDGSFVTGTANLDGSPADLDEFHVRLDAGTVGYFDAVELSDTNATVYSPPVTKLVDDGTLYNAESQDELTDRWTFADTDPVQLISGKLELLQAAWALEVENFTSGIGGGSETNPTASDGGAIALFDDTHDPEVDFSSSYKIPDGSQKLIHRHRGVYIRDWSASSLAFGASGLDITVDGTSAITYADGFRFGVGVSGTDDHYPDGAVAEDGGATTDESTEAQNTTTQDMTLLPSAPATGDKYYVAQDGDINGVRFEIGQPGAGTYTITWEYYAEEYDSGDNLVDSGWRSIPNVTDGTNGFRQSGTVSWSFSDISDDTQAGGTYVKHAKTTVGGVQWCRVRAHLTSFSSLSTQPLGDFCRPQAGGWRFRTNENVSGALASGSHTIRLNATENNGDTWFHDLVGVHDGRYSFTFDNTVDQEEGHLDGPEEKPDSVTVQANQETVSENVTEVKVTVETADHTLVGAAEVSLDGGTTWNGADVASSPDTITHTDTDNIGDTIDTRITLTRGGSTTGQTPLTGVDGGTVDRWQIQYDGTDLDVISDQTYRGSPLQIMEQLHRRAGYTWAFDYADGSQNAQRSVESFKEGSRSDTAPWTILNRNPRVSYVGYANQVTLYGKEKADGTAPKVTVQDDGEISSVGETISYTDQRPRLGTGLDEVRSAARSELSGRVTVNDIRGTLDLAPIDLKPGFTYDVDWFDDGTTKQSILLRLRITDEYQQNGAVARFNEQDGVSTRVVEQGFAIANVEAAV